MIVGRFTRETKTGTGSKSDNSCVVGSVRKFLHSVFYNRKRVLGGYRKLERYLFLVSSIFPDVLGKKGI